MSRIHRFSKRNEVLNGKKRTIKRIVFIIFIIFIVIGLIWVFHRPSLSIQTISVVGIETIDAEKIKDFTKEKISGSYLWIFPKKSIFLYPKDSITALLVDLEPKIEEIEVKIPLENSTNLNVSIQERNSNLLWCSNEWCARLDEDGTIFEEALTNVNDFFVIRNDKEPKKNLGSIVTTPDILHPIFILKSTLKKDVEFKEAIILSEGDYSLMTKEGAEIRFNKEDNLSVTADNLYTLFRSDVVSDGVGRSLSVWLSGVEYIDARFGKKIFYKER